MTSPSVSDALDRLAPSQHFTDNWDDVLARAGEDAPRPADGFRLRVQRRRRWLLAAALVAAVVVPVATGTLAATNNWWFFASHVPASATPPVVVKSGTWDGANWELVAYRTASGGICLAMTPSATATSDGRGAALACGGFSTAPQGSAEGPRGITYLSGSSSELPTYIVGPVVAAASEVVISFANGDVVRTPAFDAPASLGPVRFYATRVPESVLVPPSGRGPSMLQKLVGLDNDGQVVACLALTAASPCAHVE
jgi:hypothetical protein